MNTLIHKETQKGNQDFLNGRFFLILFKQERHGKSNPCNMINVKLYVVQK